MWTERSKAEKVSLTASIFVSAESCMIIVRDIYDINFENAAIEKFVGGIDFSLITYMFVITTTLLISM